jgi:hypothetical protein
VSYRALRARVTAAERALAANLDDTRTRWSTLKRDAKHAATPLRIVLAGFVSGWLVGTAAPLAKLGASPRLLQFVSQLASLIGALHVQQAAGEASEAAEEASAAADDAAQVASEAAATTQAVAVQADVDPDAIVDAIRRTGT